MAEAGGTLTAAWRILQAVGPVCRVDCVPRAARTPDARGRKRLHGRDDRPWHQSSLAPAADFPAGGSSLRAGIGGADPALASFRPAGRALPLHAGIPRNLPAGRPGAGVWAGVASAISLQ